MPKILCTPSLTSEDMTAVMSLAVLLDKTTEEVIRLAVRKFSAACVPTQDCGKTPAA